MNICPGCQREFEKAGSLNSHKRFCKEWQGSGLRVRDKVTSREEIKKTPADCPNCGKTFKNIYAMSSHKGHCLGLSGTKHLDSVRNWNKGKLLIDPASIFCVAENGTKPNNGLLKKYLLAEGVPNRCKECGIDKWNDKPITLELDHINGDRYDNRRKNLRLLCPNCHSQTPTWKGKGKKNHGKNKVTDEELVIALREHKTISAALESVNLGKGWNYSRCHRLIDEYDIDMSV
jgi:hypothetical protein